MFGSVIDERLAGERTHWLSPPADINMRIPDRMLNCVGFLSHDTPENVRYLGTAFIVGIKGEHNNAYLHLVTAAHVADAVEHGGFILGMNGKAGNKILLRSGDIPWWYHPTEKDSVDAAVSIFASANFGEYALEWIPVEMFATDERMATFGIGLGDELTIVGLFTRFSGKGRHFPLVRSGMLAMMPEEPVPTDYSPHTYAYLAEGRSIGGLSGSPVFVRETLNIPCSDGSGKSALRHLHGQGSFHLLGLMQGHWDTVAAFKTTEQAEAVNMGVSVVVPAKRILEILYHPELVAMRKEFDDNISRENKATSDSALASKIKPFTKEDFDAALTKVSRKIEPDRK